LSYDFILWRSYPGLVIWHSELTFWRGPSSNYDI